MIPCHAGGLLCECERKHKLNVLLILQQKLRQNIDLSESDNLLHFSTYVALKSDLKINTIFFGVKYCNAYCYVSGWLRCDCANNIKLWYFVQHQGLSSVSWLVIFFSSCTKAKVS